MKLENIDDVLKQNMSKDCSTHFLESCILDCEDYSKLYESCRNYDEFEKRVLNKECCLNDIYSAISMYGKDRGNPDDTGVFKFDLKMRKSVKDGFYNQWKYDMNHLYFARVECPRDDIFEWNKAMYKEIHIILHDMQKRHYYPLLIIVHKDQPNEYCHFHMLLDYIDPNS